MNCYREVPQIFFLKYAGHNLQKLIGYGYLKVPNNLMDPGYLLIQTWYEPSISVTVMLPKYVH